MRCSIRKRRSCSCRCCWPPPLPLHLILLHRRLFRRRAGHGRAGDGEAVFGGRRGHLVDPLEADADVAAVVALGTVLLRKGIAL